MRQKEIISRRLNNLEFLKESHEIVKYAPQYYDENGAYQKDEQIIKKKKSGCVSKTNTEIDYEAIKKKNQQKFDDKYYNHYNNMNEDYLDMYGGNEEGNKPEGLDEMMNDLDDVDVNQRKPAYTCQNNSNLSQTLNMMITSDVNMNTNNNNDNNN